MRIIKYFIFSFIVLFITACIDQENNDVYSITFIFQDIAYGIDDIENIENGSLIELPDVTLEHYDFHGWYYVIEEQKIYANQVTVMKDMILYADLIPKIYKVNLYIFNELYMTKDVTYLEDVDIPELPEIEGYIIIGWDQNLEAVDGDMDVHAILEKNTDTVNENYYSKTKTFNTYISSLDHLNPHTQTDENQIELFKLMSDALYRGDFDWELAIELGIASYIGDFTHTESLPFTYVPSMANALPVDVHGNGLVWEISLRNDLSFIDGTPITSHTFNYSYQQLLSPSLLNPNASYFLDELYLSLVNANSYRNQMSFLEDSIGFAIYRVGDVTYQRDHSYFGLTTDGFDIYHVENAYENLIGPNSEKAYVEFWGTSFKSYGQYGWVLATQDDEYFFIGTDNHLYAPTTGWTLNGEAVPAVSELPQDVSLKTGGLGYAGALPAYMDSLGNRVATDEEGIPIDGDFVYDQTESVTWSSVGFEIIDTYTLRLHLTTKKNQFEVMENLSKVFSMVVHPDHYENGMNAFGTKTNYGTIDYPAISYGRYKMSEWIEDSFISFVINEDHYDHQAYRIKSIRYDFISSQDEAVLKFKQELLDEVLVSGAYFPTYQYSPFLKISPSTTFFRFAFSIDRMNDGDPSNDNPIMKYLDFRKALYFATNREDFVKYVRSPGYPTHGMLGPIYYAGEQNIFSYRTSLPGQAVLADYAPETFGYDPVRAKDLFDQAYMAAVANGDINDGDVVSVVFDYFLHTSHDFYIWLEKSWEEIFGDTFDLILNRNCTIIDCGHYDITFGGWQGLQFNAPSMLQVYSDVKGMSYIQEVGFETGNAMISLDLKNAKQAVTSWLDTLHLLSNPKTEQMDYITLFESFLNHFEGDIYTNTYDDLWSIVYEKILYYDDYDGKTSDFDRIAAALEKSLLDQMINIPLFTTVKSMMYTNTVQFDLLAHHGRMGWGGYRYIYIANLENEAS